MLDVMRGASHNPPIDAASASTIERIAIMANASILALIAQAQTLDAATFEGRSARANAAALEKLLGKRIPDQRSIALKFNILEQLIASIEGRQATVLVLA